MGSLCSVSFHLVSLFQKKSNPEVIVKNDNDSNKSITKNTPKKETQEEEKKNG